MRHLKFDFNNMFSSNVGKDHGVRENELKNATKVIQKTHKHLKKIINSPFERIALGLEWTQLPYQNKGTLEQIQVLGDEIAKRFENVVFLGIGGSYLGLKAAQDALAPCYYNEFSPLRNKRPRIYFEGNNLDAQTLSVLIKNLEPKKTFVVVISKSGETTETKAAFQIVESWLKKHVGKSYGRQVVAITDPRSGSLRKKVNAAHSRDALSFRSLPLLKGVGGRFSEFNMGLLHLAIIGVDIKEVLAGARAMLRRCSSPSVYENPAYMYALLQTILYIKKRKSIAILMPFSEKLKSTADWYVQLLAESLGKKYGRRIETDSSGREIWKKANIVNLGRTPISARGTNDLHSIQQNNIEGENNKTVTFVRVASFARDLRTPKAGDFLSDRSYCKLLNLAHEATEWALSREKRPNCTIIMPQVNPYHWGELIFFFEIATAFEGELLEVNAFDQPGVESYKNYMYYKLRRPGMPKEIAREIKDNPLVKKTRFII
ncbi:MAG: hypothetical protein JW869_00875 [Candidatus Omnitrophica bacterium]|nr:hypothetical protein [Candidatus Omnitrophota bacterium]